MQSAFTEKFRYILVFVFYVHGQFAMPKALWIPLLCFQTFNTLTKIKLAKVTILQYVAPQHEKQWALIFSVVAYATKAAKLQQNSVPINKGKFIWSQAISKINEYCRGKFSGSQIFYKDVCGDIVNSRALSCSSSTFCCDIHGYVFEVHGKKSLISFVNISFSSYKCCNGAFSNWSIIWSL